MIQKPKLPRPFSARSALAVSLTALGYVALSTLAGRAQNALVSPPPPVLRDQGVEMAMKIKQPFTVVAVGDMLQMVPISKSNDPDVQYLMNLMRSADMTVANNENTVVDHDTFTGAISHMEAPPAVADDWANMGIKMMTKANNHTWDDGDDGLWQDFHQLDRVGIVHVGADRDQTEARLARYAATPKGTVGMVGVYSDNGLQILGLPTGVEVNVTAPQLAQLRAMRDSVVARRHEVENPIDIPPPDPEGQTMVFGITFKVGAVKAGADEATANLQRRVSQAASRRGPITTKSDTIHLTTYFGVTATQMAQLRSIAGDTGSGPVLAAWGAHFKVTPGPGEYSYDMDAQDERDTLRDIRTGKQFSDFMIAAIHWHQNRFAYQHYSFDHYPADFEIKFAHDAIDQGADMFVGHGVHTLKGVEIYKGKPIFYGVSNFVLQEQIFHSWRDTGSRKPTPSTGPIVGEAEENEQAWAWMEKPDNYKALLTSSHYENGKLTEVRIYPVDLGGLARPSSQAGIPKRPSPEEANRILGEVVSYSKPFGTKITIEDGVGVIHLADNGR